MRIRLRTIKWIINPLIGVFIAIGTNNNTFTFAALLLCLIGIVLFNENDALCLMVFVMSFTHIFKGSPGTTSFFVVLILVYALWKFFDDGKFDRGILWIVVISLYAIVVHLLSGQMQILQLVKFSANLLFLYFALKKVDVDHAEGVFLSFIAGVILSSLIKVSELFPNIVFYTEENYYEYRFTGLHEDPNYYVVNVIIALCLIVVLFHRGKLRGPIALSLALLLVWFVTLTESKSAFLMLILPAFLLLYSNQVSRKVLIQALAIVAMCVVVFLVFSGRIVSFSDVLQRFEDIDSVQELTTGRTGVWGSYMTYLSDNPACLFFGKGIGDAVVNEKVAHNTFIDLLYYLGVFGSVIFISVLVSLALASKRRIKRNFLNYSIIVCVCVMYFFLSELRYFDYPFHLLIALMVWNTDMNTGEESDMRQVSTSFCR